MHPFIYDALLSLVLVHAHTSSLAGPAPPGSTPATSLVHRVLSALIQELATQCLQAFGAVKRFGMGGMLQVGRSPVRIYSSIDAPSTGHFGD